MKSKQSSTPEKFQSHLPQRNFLDGVVGELTDEELVSVGGGMSLEDRIDRWNRNNLPLETRNTVKTNKSRNRYRTLEHDKQYEEGIEQNNGKVSFLLKLR